MLHTIVNSSEVENLWNVVTQSLTKFYTELHEDFFEVDCDEISTRMKRVR
jgi:hypothetical protein